MEGTVQLDMVLKNIVFVAGILGILAGVDLVLGAKVTSGLKKTLENMTFNIDKIIIKISSIFRKKLDEDIKFDEKIIKGKARVVLGIIFIAVSIFMILLAKRA